MTRTQIVAQRYRVHIVIAIIGFVVGLGLSFLSPQEVPSPPLQEHVSQNNYEAPEGYEQAIIHAVQKASPAVVSIIVSKDVPIIERCPSNPFSNIPPGFEDFFGFGNEFFQFYEPCQKGTEKREIGGGTGFIVSSNGLIVTNKHVVEDDEAQYSVFTNDGTEYKATIEAVHPTLDIAIIQIEGENLPTVTLGDSNEVVLGQTAIAIGNALGEFRNTVSVGVVSGLARNVAATSARGGTELIEGVIQTDAAINPGNSGGPLLNTKGEVIGINTAMVAGAQGIGFALPINAAKQSIQSVETYGEIQVAYLGVRYIMLTPERAEQYGISHTKGALLKGSEEGLAVEPGSPAHQAGLREGDVVLEVDGVTIDSDMSLAYGISQKSPGDTVHLKIARGEEEFEIDVILTKRPE